VGCGATSWLTIADILGGFRAISGPDNVGFRAGRAWNGSRRRNRVNLR